MQIHLESNEGHQILSYQQDAVVIDGITHQRSIVITPEKLITDWPITSLQTLGLSDLLPLITQHTELVLIGHPCRQSHVDVSLLSALSQRGIGFEAMAIGPACRTYTILSSESRQCIAAFIFDTSANQPKG